MLAGTTDADVLAERLSAPTIDAWGRDGHEFRDVRVLQMVAELRRSGRTALVPPGLHPTDPPSLSWQAWRVGESEFGPFTFCFARLSCRSGVRARGLTTAAYVDNANARTVLCDELGFPCRLAELQLSTHYDSTELRVALAGTTVLAITALDPEPLGAEDVQYTSTLNLAHTPNGLRLVQVEAHHEADSVERVRARIGAFGADAWGGDGLDPYWVVATTVARDRKITIPAVRFVCRADVNAFEGTEAVTH